MDSNFWTSHIAAAKRQFNLHHQLQDGLNMDDYEVEDVRGDIPCPYCCEDFDIASLCIHLEDEHSCESRAMVCPICSIKVVSDMLSHITLQHTRLFKLQRRRRLRRVAISNSQALSLFGRDLREAHLQVLLGRGGFQSSSTHATNAANDPFLSSLVVNFPGSEVDELSKSVASSTEDTTLQKTSACYWKPSFDSSLSYEEREKRIQLAAGRAGFVQDLLLCTFLGN